MCIYFVEYIVFSLFFLFPSPGLGDMSGILAAAPTAKHGGCLLPLNNDSRCTNVRAWEVGTWKLYPLNWKMNRN